MDKVDQILEEKAKKYISQIHPGIKDVSLLYAAIGGVVGEEWIEVPLPEWWSDYEEKLRDDFSVLTVNSLKYGYMLNGVITVTDYQGESYKVAAPPPGYEYCPACKSYYKHKTVNEKRYGLGFCWPCYDGLYDMCYGPEREAYDYVKAEILE